MSLAHLASASKVKCLTLILVYVSIIGQTCGKIELLNKTLSVLLDFISFPALRTFEQNKPSCKHNFLAKHCLQVLEFGGSTYISRGTNVLDEFL